MAGIDQHTIRDATVHGTIDIEGTARGTIPVLDHDATGPITATGGEQPAFDGKIVVDVDQTQPFRIELVPHATGVNFGYGIGRSEARYWDHDNDQWIVSLGLSWQTSDFDGDPDDGNDVVFDWYAVESTGSSAFTRARPIDGFEYLSQSDFESAYHGDLGAASLSAAQVRSGNKSLAMNGGSGTEALAITNQTVRGRDKAIRIPVYIPSGTDMYPKILAMANGSGAGSNMEGYMVQIDTGNSEFEGYYVNGDVSSSSGRTTFFEDAVDSLPLDQWATVEITPTTASAGTVTFSLLDASDSVVHEGWGEHDSLTEGSVAVGGNTAGETVFFDDLDYVPL